MTENNLDSEYAYRWLKRNWKILSSMERQAVAQFANDLFSMKNTIIPEADDFDRKAFFERLRGLDKENRTRTFWGSDMAFMFRIFHRPES